MAGRVSWAAGLAAGLLLAGCAAPSSSGPVGEEGPALAAFYSQVITWDACEPPPPGTVGLECATLTVPLDYARPDGETVAMALYRMPSRAEGAGSIVLLPGGPGGSGAYFAGDPSVRELAAKAHLISYDARGIGATSAFDCESDELLAARVALDPTPDMPEEEAALLAAAETLAAGCADAAGEALGFVGTRELVRDLDVLRAALSEDALSLFGISYGALVASEYARTFPDRVARAVLDAPRTAQDWAESQPPEDVPARLEAMLDAALAECFANPMSACRLGDDVGEARERVEAMVAELGDQPANAGGSVVTRERLVDAILNGVLGGGQSWSRLVLALGRASEGQWEPLVMFDTSTEEEKLLPTRLAITCADVGAPSVTVEEVRATAARWAERYPVFGELIAWSALECAGWPVGPTLEVDTEPVKLSGDVFVIATEGDPGTPTEFVEHAAEQLGGAPAMIFPGFEHITYLASDCTRFAVNAFLLEGTVPEPGTPQACGGRLLG